MFNFYIDYENKNNYNKNKTFSREDFDKVYKDNWEDDNERNKKCRERNVF